MTSTPFIPGDLVLLTGQGCSRPPAELMVVWTVVEIRGDQVVVRVEPEKQTVQGLGDLGTRRFPVSWLVLYRRVAESDENEDEEF